MSIRCSIALWVLILSAGLVLSAGAEDKAPKSIRQVQISAWIVEANDQGVRDIGANLQYTRYVDGVEQGSDVQQFNTRMMDPRNVNNTVTVPEPNRDLFPNGPRPDQEGGLQGVQAQSGGGLEFAIIPSEHGTLDGIFRSSSRKAHISLVSKPEIMVIDGAEAQIHAGGQVPYQNVKYDPNNGKARLDVKWQAIGVNMEIIPTVLSNDLVKLNLKKLEVSDIARMDKVRGVDLPVFSTRKQTGFVVVPNGSTLIVGGLISQIDRKSERRVPVLGKVPLLGFPFRSRKSEKYTSNLMIFMSPTVVDLRKMTPMADKATEFFQDKDWEHSDDIVREKSLF
jgi:type II secretory pathway component GspD/PulD (secretin)